MLKYEVEGEENMPFELSEVVTVSTAEGIDAEGTATWNFNLVQNNDIYLHISKNKNFKIENVKRGNIVIYRPSKNENKNYEYLEEYIINDSIVFLGSENTNIKELLVSNQGDVINIRICNKDLRILFF